MRVITTISKELQGIFVIPFKPIYQLEFGVVYKMEHIFTGFEDVEMTPWFKTVTFPDNDTKFIDLEGCIRILYKNEAKLCR